MLYHIKLFRLKAGLLPVQVVRLLHVDRIEALLHHESLEADVQLIAGEIRGPLATHHDVQQASRAHIYYNGIESHAIEYHLRSYMMIDVCICIYLMSYSIRMRRFSAKSL